MKNNPFTVIPAVLLAALAVPGAVYAEGDNSDGHFYLGGSTGYLTPDTSRMSGNTRTAGFQGGYQFNDRWSVELGYQMDAFSPGKDTLKMHDLEFIRHWGDEFRFLVTFGHTHINLDADSADDVTAGFHVGAGLSAFITDSLELRGDAKVIYSQDEKRTDGMGTVSLNYHFGRARATQASYEEPVLGASAEPAKQALAPIEYREPIEAEEPVVAEESVVAEEPPVAAVVPTPQSAPVASVTPTSVHTLVNFGSDSTDVGAKYGQQLDEISSQIINTNSRAVVEGHTDNQGSPSYNQVLSTDRAIVVKRELKNRGVKGEDLSIVGYGDKQPVATNETAAGREQNRRVEIKVYDKQ